MPHKRRRYHHGNLREALIDASRRLIAEKSPQGFLLSDAAKYAGVSPAAPYRHFKGKEELIEAVALDGFDLFGEDLRKAYSAKTDPFEGILALGDAYLKFAKDNQGAYMAMFESGLNITGNSQLKHASDLAFESLRQAADDLLQTIPEAQRPPVGMVAQHIWAMSHGVAELFGRGEGQNTAFAPEDLLESGIRLYLHGLGVH